MKLILTILFLASISTYSQEPRKCDSGWTWFPTMATTSLIILGDTCYPDSTYQKLMWMFEENLCGELGLFIMGGRTSYSHSSDWDSVSKKCITKDKWEMMVKGKWVEITERKYNYINRKTSKRSTYKDGVWKELKWYETQ